jgi:hypothetical protein
VQLAVAYFKVGLILLLQDNISLQLHHWRVAEI